MNSTNPPRSPHTPAPSLMRTFPLALTAVLFANAGHVCAQALPLATAASAPSTSPTLQASPSLQALPRGNAAAQLPTVLQARSIQGQTEVNAVAEGDAEFRRGGLVVRADRLSYDSRQDLASAKGRVRVSRDGAVYTGPELQLHVQRFEGWFAQPDFEFAQFGAGGRADRIEFLDGTHSRATAAEYTSCPRNTSEAPAWVLRADRVSLDLENNEGVAEGATLRFLGLPILSLPTLSFPLSDNRRSGWLPPSIDTDNRSGVEISAPYYWNIAPNRDATLTPRVITRRGLGLNSEFRYLEPQFHGALAVDWLPNDRLAGRPRDAVQWDHEGSLGTVGTGLRYSAEVVRVSDDGWWKDFPNAARSLTARLLPLRAGLEKTFAVPGGEGLAYARVQRWQVLQGADAVVVSPYQRSPQVGVRLQGNINSLAGGGLTSAGVLYSLESEYNRFTLPGGDATRNGRVGGDRWHAQGSLSWPWRDPAWFVVPRIGVNAASYGPQVPLPSDLTTTSSQSTGRATRVIPSFSVDSGLAFERQIEAFGRPVQQTLEPRLLYVNTPYRAQSQLPNYDAAGKDFNFGSIYTDNQFSGVDRVSDSHQITAGFTTRFVDANSGAEALRLGLVQRYLFRTQQVTAQTDGTPDGPPQEQRFSDALLLGSTSLVPNWTLDAAAQFNPEIQRSVRSIVGARYSPGPYRTLSATYRLARGLNEQLELGWQWPIWKDATSALTTGSSLYGSLGSGTAGCKGTWYAVGRVNYSLRDTRITDSVLGLEYDAGCWIGRFVAERLSTGSSQATTRFMLQLELVGLSRIGSNPLKVLKDNIPGYRLLREERRSGSPADDAVTD
jgi:LPS-assembly protein